LQFSNYAVSSIGKAANLTATNPHVFMWCHSEPL